jgi:hypothetical protein
VRCGYDGVTGLAFRGFEGSKKSSSGMGGKMIMTSVLVRLAIAVI